MNRYSVPLTLLTTVSVFASSKAAALSEAIRLTDEMRPTSDFLSGWNSQQEPGKAVIDEVTALDVETTTYDEIEDMGPRWAVEAQRDNHADLPADERERAGTWLVSCADDVATSFGVFEARDNGSELIEDYPTRAAAESAVAALAAGQPLPEPMWEPLAPIVLAQEMANALEAIAIADATPDATAFAAAMRNATDLLARMGVKVKG